MHPGVMHIQVASLDTGQAMFREPFCSYVLDEASYLLLPNRCRQKFQRETSPKIFFSLLPKDSFHATEKAFSVRTKRALAVRSVH